MGKLKWFYLHHLLADLRRPFIKPRPKIWLFSSSFNTAFNYNSKSLFIYVLRHHPEITCRYVINDDEKRKQLQREYGPHFIETKTRKGIRKALEAGVWLLSAGMPVYMLFPGKKRIVFNLWHGTPLKHIACKDNTNRSFLQQVYLRTYFSRNYTYITAQSTRLKPVYAANFGVPEEKIKALGQPRLDELTRKQPPKEVLGKLFEDLPSYRKTLLYAPTFREKGATRLFPFPDFDPEALTRFLEEEQLLLLIRFHQSEKANLPFAAHERIRFINQDKVSEITEALNIFDLLIADYSSIYIDFLLTEKPQLFLPYDLTEYRQIRGFNFDYNEVTPGPKPTTFNDFCQALKKLLDDPSYYADQRKEINDFFNEVKEGNCANIVDFLKRKQSLKSEANA